jgi:hypothetical protein
LRLAVASDVALSSEGRRRSAREELPDSHHRTTLTSPSAGNGSTKTLYGTLFMSFFAEPVSKTIPFSVAGPGLPLSD